jgi:sarcosine oxidase
VGETFDVAVVGAGVFGAWTAFHLRQAGASVLLVDAYGAAHGRASSGGESRIIRASYGPDELYSRWTQRSLEAWRGLSESTPGPPLFHETGVLWLARGEDQYSLNSLETLERIGFPFQRLSRSDLEAEYPQMAFAPDEWALFEPTAGALMARRAVQTLVGQLMDDGLEFRVDSVRTPTGTGSLAELGTGSGARLVARAFAFACGPWLPKLFPSLLEDRIFPTKQEVYFFGSPPGDRRFAPPALPTWADFGEEIYGLPDLESRGAKVSVDRHGPGFDPDDGPRSCSPRILEEIRAYLARRLPALANAPVVETRVCQYENTSNGDFLVDRHPDFDNVWLVGGGSGHGFKHGPALGDFVASLIAGRPHDEPRFSLATKATVQRRTVR